MAVSSTNLPQPDPRELGPGLLRRLLLGIAGWGLLFSAFGLWAVPGSDNVPELSLMKLGLSVFMLLTGLCCIVSTRRERDRT